jgi:hypothetical protein
VNLDFFVLIKNLYSLFTLILLFTLDDEIRLGKFKGVYFCWFNLEERLDYFYFRLVLLDLMDDKIFDLG